MNVVFEIHVVLNGKKKLDRKDYNIQYNIQ